MPAVSTMLLNSLVMTGEKSIGDTFNDATEEQYYLSRLNGMIDSWSNERLMMLCIQQTSFALTASTGTYSIGNGGAFNMTRPTKIVDPCFIRDSQNVDQELTLLDALGYGRIVQKNSNGAYPIYLFYDQSFSGTSTATIKLWPLPIGGLTLFLNTLQPLTNFSTMSQNLIMPPGWQRAIETNFAVESAPGFVRLSPDIMRIAKESKSALKSTNSPAPVSRLDYGVRTTPTGTIITGP